MRMRVDRWSWPSLVLVLCGSAACPSDGGSSNAPGSDAASGPVRACAAGDRSAGQELVTQLRAQRLEAGEDPTSYAQHRSTLRDACGQGCGAACLEFARNSWEPSEADEFNTLACTHDEPDGCAWAGGAAEPARGELCERGDPLACVDPAPEHLASQSAAACETNDGRSCSTHAWARCGEAGECDELAIESARKAAQLVPEPAIIETLGAVYCHAGQLEQADASFAEACERGEQDSCGRRCEQLRPARTIVVREAERETYAEILTMIALQSNAREDWYLALSVMSLDELREFEAALQRFTPALSEPGAKAKVPEAVREQYPELVAALLRGPQLDAKKLVYWFKRLPDMTDEQRTNLLESLRSQWWVIPGDPNSTPDALVERVRNSSGGLR
jgi:tetratricopeptide (TPR) repeat protein